MSRSRRYTQNGAERNESAVARRVVYARLTEAEGVYCIRHLPTRMKCGELGAVCACVRPVRASVYAHVYVNGEITQVCVIFAFVCVRISFFLCMDGIMNKVFLFLSDSILEVPTLPTRS